MPETPDPAVDDLRAALASTAQVIDEISAGQWGSSTPCAGWDARTVLEHLIEGNARVAGLLGGRSDVREAVTDPTPRQRFQESGSAVMAAFDRPGVLRELVTLPLGTVPGRVALHLRTVDVLVHGWDLARATDQHATFPDGVAERQLPFSRSALAALPPDRRPFAAPQAVPEHASAMEQLVALLGRTVLT